MPRPLFIAASVVTLFAACVPSFQNRRTPSGDFCSDMPVLPAGQAPDREYHRLRPVSSDPEAHTEAERLESLRKAACTAGADAVIEAANEEVRLSNATYNLVSSGTAITWVRHGQAEFTPLKSYPTNAGPKPSASAAATPAPEPEPAAATEPEPAPAGSGKAAAGAASGKAAAGTPPAGSAKATTPAASSSAKAPALPTTPKKKP